MKVGSGAYEGPFTFASRFESGRGMLQIRRNSSRRGARRMFLDVPVSLAHHLRLHVHMDYTTVHLGEGPAISLIELNTEAEVPV